MALCECGQQFNQYDEKQYAVGENRTLYCCQDCAEKYGAEKKTPLVLWSFTRLWLPLLFLHIQLPFVEVYTAIMNHRYERMEREYVALCIRIYKWSFSFCLYDTYRRMMTRRDFYDKRS